MLSWARGVGAAPLPLGNEPAANDEDGDDSVYESASNQDTPGRDRSRPATPTVPGGSDPTPGLGRYASMETVLMGSVTIEGRMSSVQLVLSNDAISIVNEHEEILRTMPLSALESVTADSAFGSGFTIKHVDSLETLRVTNTTEHGAAGWVRAISVEMERKLGSSKASGPALPNAPLRPSTPDIERRPLVGPLFTIAIAFILFGCISVLGAKHYIILFWLGPVSWMVGSYMYHGYPWAMGRVLSILVPFLYLVFTCGLSAWETIRVKDQNYPRTETGTAALSGLTQLCFTFGIFSVLPTIWYFCAQRKTPASWRFDPYQADPRRCCVRDARRAFIVVIVLIAILVPTLETIGVLIGAPAYWTFITLSIYVIFFAILIAIMWMSRRRHPEYAFQYMLCFNVFLSFFLFVCGRVIDMVLAVFGGSPTERDTYFPFILILYKGLFLLYQPLVTTVAQRMARREDQLRYEYPQQVMNSVVLDAYTAFSPRFTPYFVIFAVVRVIWGTFYHAGVFRAIGRRCDCCTGQVPEDSIGHMMPRMAYVARSKSSSVVAPKSGKSSSTVAPASGKGGLRDAVAQLATSFNAPEEIASPRVQMHHSTHSASSTGTPSTGGSSPEAMRRPYGGSPLSLWLFWCQEMMSSLCSSLMIMSMAAIDISFGKCVFVCNMSVADVYIVEARTATLLLSWCVLFALTAAFHLRRMREHGFTNAELFQLTAKHFRRHMIPLALMCFPVITYTVTDAADAIRTLNAEGAF